MLTKMSRGKAIQQIGKADQKYGNGNKGGEGKSVKLPHINAGEKNARECDHVGCCKKGVTHVEIGGLRKKFTNQSIPGARNRFRHAAFLVLCCLLSNGFLTHFYHGHKRKLL